MRHLFLITILSLVATPLVANAYSVIETSDGVPTHWESDSVAWHLDDAGTSELGFGDVVDALEGALEAWSDVSESSLAVTYAGSIAGQSPGYTSQGDNENLVIFLSSGWAYGNQALAVTLTTWSVPSGRLLDADILVNTVDYNWAVDGSSNYVDLQSALAHEMGHAVGLGHSEIPAATMYASMALGSTGKRHLHVDDANGYRFLYNDEDVVEPEPDPDPDPIDEPDDPNVDEPSVDEPGTDPQTDQPGDEPQTDQPGDEPQTDQPGDDPQQDPNVDEPGDDPQDEPQTEPSDDPQDGPTADEPDVDEPEGPSVPDEPASPTEEPAPSEAPETPEIPDVPSPPSAPAPADGAIGVSCSTSAGQADATTVLFALALLGLAVLRQRARRAALAAAPSLRRDVT